ncbi:hypothetical protein BDQ17DRAFT_1363226 [Cyathus striatus]|nr:hypothetical protein BDQ17DRAFT_1363226 [Cyathus striatus]
MRRGGIFNFYLFLLRRLEPILLQRRGIFEQYVLLYASGVIRYNLSGETQTAMEVGNMDRMEVDKYRMSDMKYCLEVQGQTRHGWKLIQGLKDRGKRTRPFYIVKW